MSGISAARQGRGQGRGQADSPVEGHSVIVGHAAPATSEVVTVLETVVEAVRPHPITTGPSVRADCSSPHTVPCNATAATCEHTHNTNFLR